MGRHERRSAVELLDEVGKLSDFGGVQALFAVRESPSQGPQGRDTVQGLGVSAIVYACTGKADDVADRLVKLGKLAHNVGEQLVGLPSGIILEGLSVQVEFAAIVGGNDAFLLPDDHGADRGRARGEVVEDPRIVRKQIVENVEALPSDGFEGRTDPFLTVSRFYASLSRARRRAWWDILCGPS